MEDATGRTIIDARHDTGDGCQAALFGCALGQGLQQSGRVRMPRRHEQALGWRLLNHLPRVHDDDAVHGYFEGTMHLKVGTERVSP